MDTSTEEEEENSDSEEYISPIIIIERAIVIGNHTVPFQKLAQLDASTITVVLLLGMSELFAIGGNKCIIWKRRRSAKM